MGLEFIYEEDRLKNAREKEKELQDRGREHDAVLRQRQARVNVKTALAAAFALAEEWVYTAQASAEMEWGEVAKDAFSSGAYSEEAKVAEAIEALVTAGLVASWKTEKAKNDWSRAVEKAMTVGHTWCTAGPIAIHEKIMVLLRLAEQEKQQGDLT